MVNMTLQLNNNLQVYAVLYYIYTSLKKILSHIQTYLMMLKLWSFGWSDSLAF